MAYFTHLIVPILLLLDAYDAWRLQALGRGEKAVGAVAALWLALGVLVPMLSDRRRLALRLPGVVTFVYALYLGLFASELTLRALGGTRGPALFRPGMRFTLHPDPVALSGIPGGVSQFTVNESGLRGPALPRDPRTYRIITVGGSSTECLYLDDSKQWPYLLMERLNAVQQQRRVWVANAGVSGHTAVHHLVLLETLPILREAHLLIITMGVNDLGWTLALYGRSTQAALEEESAVWRNNILAGGWRQRPYLRRSRLFELTRRALLALRKDRGSSTFAQSDSGRELIGFRKARMAGPILPLPDLQIGLQEYRSRIGALAGACATLHTRCLFVTQAALWRPDLKPEEEKLLWLGWLGSKAGFVKTADQARAMAAYNRALLDECQKQNLECLDMASMLPSTSAVFYDDVHFNERGAELVASYLATYLAGRAPFATATVADQLGESSESRSH